MVFDTIRRVLLSSNPRRTNVTLYNQGGSRSVSQSGSNGSENAYHPLDDASRQPAMPIVSVLTDTGMNRRDMVMDNVNAERYRIKCNAAHQARTSVLLIAMPDALAANVRPVNADIRSSIPGLFTEDAVSDGIACVVTIATHVPPPSPLPPPPLLIHMSMRAMRAMRARMYGRVGSSTRAACRSIIAERSRARSRWIWLRIILTAHT